MSPPRKMTPENRKLKMHQLLGGFLWLSNDSLAPHGASAKTAMIMRVVKLVEFMTGAHRFVCRKIHQFYNQLSGILGFSFSFFLSFSFLFFFFFFFFFFFKPSFENIGSINSDKKQEARNLFIQHHHNLPVLL